MDFCQYEYTAKKERRGLYGMLRWLLIFAYVAFVGVYFLIIFLTRMIPLGALIPIALWILVFLTWKFVCIEYKYEISGSELTFYTLYGKKKKLKAKIYLNEAEVILPLDEADEQIKKFGATVQYNALPRSDEPDAYVILYRDREGKKCCFKFKATAEALHCIRLYNKSLKTRETAI